MHSSGISVLDLMYPFFLYPTSALTVSFDTIGFMHQLSCNILAAFSQLFLSLLDFHFTLKSNWLALDTQNCLDLFRQYKQLD